MRLFMLLLTLLIGIMLWGLYDRGTAESFFYPKTLTYSSAHDIYASEEMKDDVLSMNDDNTSSVDDNTTQLDALPCVDDVSTENKHVHHDSINDKPFVAIIIDDINREHQLKQIDSLPIKVTPAIMPNNALNPKSSSLAKNRDVYLVHLPLEAHRFYQREHIVLEERASPERIESRIEEIWQQFPTMRFLNNHTGSKFTENFNAMLALLKALKRRNVIFLDSKTTHKSAAYKAASAIGMRIVERDVFLDYDKTRESIARQLNVAIKIAKKRGYAIAIGHPYPETFAVLSQTSWTNKGVEFVYFDTLLEEKIWR